MIERRHGGEALDRLLKIARADANALRIDLADIERARLAAEASLSRLGETAKREDGSMESRANANLPLGLEGARERRLQLQAIVLTLADAAARTRDQLEAAEIEIEKFEQLTSLNAGGHRREGVKCDRRAGRDVERVRAS